MKAIANCSNIDHLAFDAAPLRIIRSIGQAVLVWNKRFADRRHLAELPYEYLVDVGLSEADRQIEINKPFWRS